MGQRFITSKCISASLSVLYCAERVTAKMQIAFRRKQYCISVSFIHPRESGGKGDGWSTEL